MWYCYKDECTNKPSQIVSENGAEGIQPGKEQSFQSVTLGALGIHIQKISLMSYVKINSKWIININIRPQTIKFLENVGNSFMILGLSMTSYIGIIGKGNKTQTDKFYFMKIEIWYFKGHYRSKKELQRL